MADDAAKVLVLFSPAPRHVLEWTVQLGPGATVLDALHVSGLPAQAPELERDRANVAIWGRKVGLRDLIHDGDRVEVLRPLRIDPKVARRERFRRQGVRAAGLFSRKGSECAPDENRGLD